ncbi:MAG: hypothetical protein ACLFTQ_03365 [Candidatus Aenigmatarchaeota archaeon]
MKFGRKHWRSLLISAIVVSGAFTVQDIRPKFFILCFAIVLVSYLLHELLHMKVADAEGLHLSCDLSGAGLLTTIISGVVSGGLAVIAIPLETKVKEFGSERWMKESKELDDRDVGLISIVGPLLNLVLGTLFLGLFSFYGMDFLWLVSLINFWMGVSNFIPIHPFDGGNIVAWSGWLWFTGIMVGATGLGSLFLLM